MSAPAPSRPAIVTEAHLQCLDEALEEFGERPMLGALLQLKFGLTRADALAVLGYWINTYVARHGSRRTSAGFCWAWPCEGCLRERNASASADSGGA
jgi:hypothetical protein